MKYESHWFPIQQHHEYTGYMVAKIWVDKFPTNQPWQQTKATKEMFHLIPSGLSQKSPLLEQLYKA